LYHKFILERRREIQFSLHKTLSCRTYDALEKNNSNILFVHYKQADRLQKLLAKYYCPHMLSQEAIHANVANDKNEEGGLRGVNVPRKKGNRIVPLDDWLKENEASFQWGAHSSKESKRFDKTQECLAQTEELERSLFSCDDEVMKY
jgi:hypothetical protein